MTEKYIPIFLLQLDAFSDDLKLQKQTIKCQMHEMSGLLSQEQFCYQMEEKKNYFHGI